jgi:tRNA modification GTPase
VETDLEFETEETGADGPGALREQLGECVADIQNLAEAGKRQSAHRRGAVVALCGKPNVGKSSLLNRILRRQRSIVSSVPGTTRDTIEEAVEVDGLPIVFIDTAGYFAAQSEPDVLGVERTIQAVADADFILFLLDLSRNVDNQDRAVLAQVRAVRPQSDLIVLANKCDLVSSVDTAREAAATLSLPCPRLISAKTGANVDDVLDDLRQRIRSDATLTGHVDFLINDRHAVLLADCAQKVMSARDSQEQGVTLDIIADDLHAAHKALGRILATEGGEDILDKVFSRFCIGK